MKQTRVAVVQTDTRFGAVVQNIDGALRLMKSKKADLYVLPELFATGYNIRTRKEIHTLSEKAGEGPTGAAMIRFAKKSGAYIVYGFAEKSGATLYNASALVGPEGLLGVYRKIHLFWREKLFFSPGNLPFRVYRLPIGRIGMMICFDWYFPESARCLARKGSQLIAHPSNLVLPNCPEGMKLRCLENRVFAATADRIGTEKRGGQSLRYIGMSEIVSPKGKVLKRLSTHREEIGVVAITLGQANDKKASPMNHLFKDQRPSFY